MGLFIVHTAVVLAFCLSVARGAAAPLPAGDPALVAAIHSAIEKGNAFLLGAQNSNGWWSTADHPSVTALAIPAILGVQRNAKASAAVKKGYAYILRCVQPDGGIYVTNLPNYNTSICMMGLLAAHDASYDPVIRKARSFVAGMQADLGEPGKLDTPWDGGIGYSHNAGRSDMNNTLTALEALYYSKHLAADRNAEGARDLNWAAAIHFLENCQNLPERNKQTWVSTNPKDRGGFVYDPDSSKAGSATNTNGKVALRSYGSISYAGLLSYIYADVKASDPRVQAVMDWLRANYSLEENPGMGQQGYYYYLHLMTKALNAAQVKDFMTPSGNKADWRREVATRLVKLQKPDGSWENSNGRWWEKDPVLVTAYSMLALEIIDRGM